MKPNENYAVTARRDAKTAPIDDFPTPPWATRALLTHVIKPHGTVWEPACGRCYMSVPLKEYFGASNVLSTDKIDYGSPHQDAGYDFVNDAATVTNDVNWMITNPPFSLAQQFVVSAYNRGIRNVAILVRTQFLEGIGRYNDLYSWWPPATVAQFSERVPMVEGRVDKDASTATSYCWIIWRPLSGKETNMVWIPPCRRSLEKDSDYIKRGY